MSSIAKKIVLGMGVLGLFVVGVGVVAQEAAIPTMTTMNNPQLYDFSAGQTASVEEDRQIQPSDFIALQSSDERVLSNPQFEVYLNRDTTGIKIRNRQTGYIWNSVIADVDAGTFDGLLSSSIGLEYINIEQNLTTRENIGLRDTAHQVTSEVIGSTLRLTIDVDGLCATRQCSQFYPEYLAGNPSYSLDRLITLGFVNLDLSFVVEITLTEEGITVVIPEAELRQGNSSQYVLSSLIVFPGLGATFQDDIPGYMVLPDGMGALIRYASNEGEFVATYDERFYGSDPGIVSVRSSVTNERLLMPIYGAVHGSNQHAFLAIIEEGDVNARLIAFPAGASNVPYNLIYPKFDLNQTYVQSFTSDGLGGVRRIHQAMNSDIRLQYRFLSNESANYVGMGLAYQDYLVNQGVLQPLSSRESIPMHTQILMADSRAQFVGNQVIPMTTFDQATVMLQTLQEGGVVDPVISLRGWNQGGYSGQLPSRLRIASQVGSNRGFESFVDTFASSDIYLLNNYMQANQNSSRIRYRRDVAMGVNQFRLVSTCSSCVYEREVVLFPSSSVRLAMADQADVREANVHVLFERLGTTLLSYYQQETYQRQDALETYQEVMQAYQGSASYEGANAYAWPYMNTYFDTPIDNSQLKIFDETIPLLSIVLAGHMELFSPFLNFNSTGREQLLQMIDFNVYPSYIMSHERSSALKGSDLESLYATTFDAWSQTMQEEYAFINEALQAVYGARFVGRERLLTDVVRTTFDNGVQVIINYSAQAVTIDNSVIPAQSYFVVGGSQ